MEETNKPEAPRLKINWKHFILVVLHFVVFMSAVFSENMISTRVAARALP